MSHKISLIKNISNEFKKFALRGNVIDLAVGIIIGGAFGKIVSSLVTDIITPPIGFVMGKIQFSDLFIALSSRSFDTLASAKEAGVPVISYGLFLDNLIAFMITAFAVFVLVKAINKIKDTYEKEQEKSPQTKSCSFCDSIISIKAIKCPHCTSDIA